MQEQLLSSGKCFLGFQRPGMLSVITLFGVILKTCFISKRKKRLLWMCKQWSPPVDVYVDTAKHLPGEERLLILAVCLGMACLDVVSRCLCTKGFPGFGLGENSLPCSQASGVACEEVGVAEMQFFGLKCTLKVNTVTRPWSALRRKAPLDSGVVEAEL